MIFTSILRSLSYMERLPPRILSKRNLRLRCPRLFHTQSGASPVFFETNCQQYLADRRPEKNKSGDKEPVPSDLLIRVRKADDFRSDHNKILLEQE